MISLFDTVRQRVYGRSTIHVRHNCRRVCSICRCFVCGKGEEVSIKVKYSIRRTKIIITHLDSTTALSISSNSNAVQPRSGQPATSISIPGVELKERPVAIVIIHLASSIKYRHHPFKQTSPSITVFLSSSGHPSIHICKPNGL